MTRAIYDKAIYKRKQQMDRAVYKRARNVLPTGGGSIEPSNQDWYVLKSVQVIDGGAGFQQYNTFAQEFFQQGAKSDIPPTIEVDEVDENGGIVSIGILDGGMVTLSENDGTLPTVIILSPDESSTTATIACNWAPLTVNTAKPFDEWGERYNLTDASIVDYRPIGGFGYTPDEGSTDKLTYVFDNGAEGIRTPIVSFTVTDGVLSNPVIEVDGVFGFDVTDDGILSQMEIIVPGNPGKGCLLYIETAKTDSNGGE